MCASKRESRLTDSPSCLDMWTQVQKGGETNCRAESLNILYVCRIARVLVAVYLSVTHVLNTGRDEETDRRFRLKPRTFFPSFFVIVLLCRHEETA